MSDAEQLDDLELGPQWWQATCPNCGRLERLYAAIAVRLTVPSDGSPALKLTCKALALEHECRQLHLDVSTGEIVVGK